MISLLTDVNDEEVKKAATFVLQTCKKLSELFSSSRDIYLYHYSPIIICSLLYSSPAGSIAGQSVESDLQRHRRSAWEIQQRIQQLERQHMVCVCDIL